MKEIEEKKFFTVPEAAQYLGRTNSYVYQKVSRREIPFYKPSHKCLLFKRTELDGWLELSRVSSDAELEQAAAAVVLNPKTRKNGK